MFRSSGQCALAFLLSFLLLSGCVSRGPRSARAAKSKTGSLWRPTAEEPRERRIAQAHAHFATAVVHEAAEETDAALDEYYQAVMLDPENESLVLEVSKKFLQNKQPQKALQILLHAAAMPSSSGLVDARLGVVYSQLGQFQKAVEADRAAIRKSPEELSGYQNLYLNSLQLKDRENAKKALDDAARQVRVDADFLVGLAELYLNFGAQAPSEREAANTQARAVLHRAQKLELNTPSLRLKLGDALNLAGDPSGAAQVYLDLLRKFPNVPMLRERLRARLTDVYLRGSDHKGAIEQLKAIIKDDPTNAQAYYYLGSILYEDKQVAEALDYFEKTILLSPDFEPPYYDLAGVQLALNKPAEALATLSKARQKFAPNFVMEFLLGMAFSQQKAYSEALQHLTSAEVIAKASDPGRLNDYFYFQYGATSERKGDYEQAEKAFRTCLKLKPDSAEALNYLGYMWAEHGTNLVEARTMIEKAVKLQPENAAYLDSLAWVLYKSNQPKEALEYALKAVQLSPEEPDATVFEHLGDVYASLGQREKAVEAWRKALKLEPSDGLRKKLDDGAEAAQPPSK